MTHIKMDELNTHIKKKIKILTKEMSIHLTDEDINKIKQAKSEIEVDNIGRDLIDKYWG